MSRWINKMITRHLEPGLNVRPLLAGIYQRAAPEQGMPVTDEELALSGEEMSDEVRPSARREKDLRGEENIVTMEGTALKRPGTALQGPGAALKGPGAALQGEGAVWREEGPALGEEETVWRGEERAAGNEQPAEKNISSEPRLADDREVLEMPGKEGQEKTRAAAEKKIIYVAEGDPEEPVLQDRRKGFPSEQVERGKEEVVRNLSGIVRKGEETKMPARQTIHVSIGRIEIKAVMPAEPPAEEKALPVKKDTAIMGLNQYLEKRNPGKR